MITVMEERTRNKESSCFCGMFSEWKVFENFDNKDDRLRKKIDEFLVVHCF